jgi:hypothetical protein
MRAKVQQAKKKEIPRPETGRAGAGYNLQEAMKLGHRKDKYNHIRVCFNQLAMFAHLNCTLHSGQLEKWLNVPVLIIQFRGTNSPPKSLLK